MKVTLLNVTPNAQDHIVEVARVSSSRKNKKDKPEGLLSYLVRHKHWSPFEHGHATFEIETSKAIGIQLIRHRSFSFQEFSQRYQDVNRLGHMFEPIELRAQAEDNRQSSTEVIDPEVHIGGGYTKLGDLIEMGMIGESDGFLFATQVGTKLLNQVIYHILDACE